MSSNTDLQRQAQLATTVRYGPELDALRFLYQNATTNYQQTLHNSKAGANMIIAAAKAAQPQLLAGYTRLLGSGDAAHAQFTQDLQGLGSAADQVRAQGNSEAAIAAQNMGLSAQAALSLLGRSQVRAAEGAAYQGQQAQRQYRQDVGQVEQRQQSVANEAGAFAAQQFGQLVGDRQKRQFDASQKAADRATRLAAAGQTPEGTFVPGGPHDPAVIRKAHPGRAGRNGLTPVQQIALHNKYGDIRDQINKISSILPTLQGVTVHYNPQTGAVISPDKTGALPSGTKVRHLTGAEINAALGKKFPKATPLQIHAARELLAGGLTPGTVHAIKTRYPKIGVPGHWLYQTPQVGIFHGK